MAISVFALVFGAYRVGKEDRRKEQTRSPLSLAYYLESRGLRLHVSSPEPGIYYLSESWRPPHALRVLLTPMDDLPGHAAAWNGMT